MATFKLVFLFLYIYIKKWKGKELKILRILFITIAILEIFKICYVCFYQKLSSKLDDWVPLYFCSLTMYALGMSSFCKGKIKELGDTFLFFGGVISGLCFLLYPTTALIIRPLIHPLTIHSMIFHCVSVFSGLMVVINKYFIPNKKHIVSYLIFTLSFSLIAYIVNLLTNHNFMLISSPWEMKPLQLIYDIVGPFYPLVIALGQCLITFYLSYLGYILYSKTKKKGVN